jgi:two-component sensor histidine kinase
MHLLAELIVAYIRILKYSYFWFLQSNTTLGMLLRNQMTGKVEDRDHVILPTSVSGSLTKGKVVTMPKCSTGTEGDHSGEPVPAESPGTKCLLIRELEHRTMNSFQLIQSMVVLLSEQVSDPGVRDRITKLSQQINAVVLAHGQLSYQDLRLTVELGSYLKALSCTFNPPDGRFRITTELDACDMPHDQAFYLGLILNEAVTNAAKHAFPETRGGTVTVTLAVDPATETARLSISDDGAGMDRKRTSGVGLQLVEELSHRIGGHLQLKTSTTGTVLSVTFPTRASAGQSSNVGEPGQCSAASP